MGGIFDKGLSFTLGQEAPGYAALVAGNRQRVAGRPESSQPLDDARKGMLLGWRIGGAIAALQSLAAGAAPAPGVAGLAPG